MINNLKELRCANGLTQEKLCLELRKKGFYIDRTTYSKYETGSRSLPCEALMKFASFYGTSCDYILGLQTTKITADSQ